MTQITTEQPDPIAQECADYATSLRSAIMLIKLEGRTPPFSFLRSADLFERAATELNIKHNRIQEPEDAQLRDLICRIVNKLDEGDNGNAPGHAHLIPGVWDADNGEKSGSQCEWCALWAQAVAVRDSAQADQGEQENG